MKIKTLQDLQQYAYERHMNLEKMRFMLGANTYEPKYFGIYYDEKNHEWVVYKNKVSGEKVERYRGYDESIAVNILFDKLNEEIALRGGNVAYKTSSKYQSAKLNMDIKPSVDQSDLDVFEAIDTYLNNHQIDASIMQIVVGKRSYEAYDLGIFRNASSEYVIYYVDEYKITKTLLKTPYKEVATGTFVELMDQRVMEGVGEVDMSSIHTSYVPRNQAKDVFQVSNQRNNSRKKEKAGITVTTISLALGGITMVGLSSDRNYYSNYIYDGYYLVGDDLYYHFDGNWYELNEEIWYLDHLGSASKDDYVGYDYLNYSDPLAFTNSYIFKNENRREGYYHRDDELYYLLDNHFYYYDDGSWILYDDYDYDGDWYDYYYGNDYTFDNESDSFYESDYYEDYYASYDSSSSDNDDDDDDWDWTWVDDDDDDWDFFDSWDSGDTNWDSDW